MPQPELRSKAEPGLGPSLMAPRNVLKAGEAEWTDPPPPHPCSHSLLLLSNHLEITEVDSPQCRSENAGQAWGQPADGDR